MQRTPPSHRNTPSSRRQIATNTVILGTAVLLVAGVGVALAQNDRVKATNAEAGASYTPQALPTSTAATPNVKLELPADPSVLVLGDSFSLGVGAKPRSRGYVDVLADEMGWTNVTVDGAGATGFVADNKGRSPVYEERLRKRIESSEEAPDMVIMQGAVNDTSATSEEMRQAVSGSLASIQSGWPGTDIVVTAPITYRNFGRIETAMADAVSGKDVVYLNDGMPRAWLPQSRELHAEDEWHPSTEGHARIAAAMAEALQSHMG